MNTNDGLIPPVDQIFPALENPAWLACLADGNRGGDADHVPAGHALTFNSSTNVVELKYPPPVASPPIAKSLLDALSYASPKSALCGVNTGPVDHVPAAMSSLYVPVLLAAGACGPF